MPSSGSRAISKSTCPNALCNAWPTKRSLANAALGRVPHRRLGAIPTGGSAITTVVQIQPLYEAWSFNNPSGTATTALYSRRS
jgi:hypothetical protein